MERLKQCILSQVAIDPHSMDTILSSFETVTSTKGDFFLTPEKICNHMAFIESGYMRMYDIVDGKEVTLWIGGEGKFVTSLSSFVFQTPNHWYIQAITDCTLYTIHRELHYKLNKTIPTWLEFDNILLANAFALLEKSMFAQLHTTAKQRYEKLLAEEPALFRHVPLQHIATMLGITPESLSRLRKLK